MIAGMFNSGAIPVLERVVQFTGARHDVILNNLANLSTPNFVPREVSVESFQHAMGEAIDERRENGGGELEMDDTRMLDFKPHGIELHPRPANNNILFHDRNNRSLERMMENLASNAMAHNTALRLLNDQFALLETAIRGRV